MKNPVQEMIKAAKAIVKCGSVPKKRKIPFTSHVAAAAARKGNVPVENLKEEKWSSKLNKGYDKKDATVYHYLKKKYGATRKSVTTISFNSKYTQKNKGGKNEEIEVNHFSDPIHQNVLDWENNQP